MRKEGNFMAFCPNCGAQVEDGAPVCPNCGTSFAAPQVNYAIDPKDHTAEFDPKDISDNKVFAMAAYLLSIIGVIITLLAAQKSDYAMFWARQALKMTVCTVLCAIMFIVPFLGWFVGAVCLLIIFVLKIICFFYICNGKAKEVPIICNFGFLK